MIAIVYGIIITFAAWKMFRKTDVVEFIEEDEEFKIFND